MGCWVGCGCFNLTMATIIPTSQPTGVEAYEDMFKEITRKLYGDETGHGLHTLGTPIAHVVTGGPTAPEGGERSFTTLVGFPFFIFLKKKNFKLLKVPK